MENEIRQIMARVFEIDSDALPTALVQKELPYWDSLRHLNLIVELELAFDVSYEPEEIGRMNSLEKIIEYTKGKLEK